MSKVCVVVPVYNGAEYLRTTLDSILASDYPDLDVMVLDNASTDETPEILASIDDPRLRVEHNAELLPLADNWQRAMDLASGDYVKIVCADDVMRADSIARQAAILDADPTLAMTVGRHHYIDGRGRVLAYAKGLVGLTGRRSARTVARHITLLGINPIGPSVSLLFRRDAFEAIGGFDRSICFPMDVDLWLRLLERGDMYGEREAYGAFRLSDTSLSSRHDDVQYDEHRDFVERVAEDERWSAPAIPDVVRDAWVRIGWVAWSLRDRLWRSRLLETPRPLGEPRPFLRGILPL